MACWLGILILYADWVCWFGMPIGYADPCYEKTQSCSDKMQRWSLTHLLIIIIIIIIIMKPRVLCCSVARWIGLTVSSHQANWLKASRGDVAALQRASSDVCRFRIWFIVPPIKYGPKIVADVKQAIVKLTWPALLPCRQPTVCATQSVLRLTSTGRQGGEKVTNGIIEGVFSVLFIVKTDAPTACTPWIALLCD